MDAEVTQAGRAVLAVEAGGSGWPGWPGRAGDGSQFLEDGQARPEVAERGVDRVERDGYPPAGGLELGDPERERGEQAADGLPQLLGEDLRPHGVPRVIWSAPR